MHLEEADKYSKNLFSLSLHQDLSNSLSSVLGIQGSPYSKHELFSSLIFSISAPWIPANGLFGILSLDPCCFLAYIFFFPLRHTKLDL